MKVARKESKSRHIVFGIIGCVIAITGTAWFLIHNPYLFYENKSIQNKDDVISLVYENRNELERAMKDCSRLEQKRDMLRQIAIIPTPYRGEAGLTDMISAFGMNEWFDALSVETFDCYRYSSDKVYFMIGFETEEDKIEGIYYDSKPHPYDWQIEMQENDGLYTQQGAAKVYGQAWEYETYQIEDNWYYYCVVYGEDLGFRRLS